MQIKTPAVAGTMESSDIMIRMEPGEGGIAIALESTVMQQFGAQIESVIRDTLTQLGIGDVRVTAVDKGALDCTVRARVLAAAYRAAGREDYHWEVKP
mgnify:FL=1